MVLTVVCCSGHPFISVPECVAFEWNTILWEEYQKKYYFGRKPRLLRMSKVGGNHSNGPFWRYHAFLIFSFKQKLSMTARFIVPKLIKFAKSPKHLLQTYENMVPQTCLFWPKKCLPDGLACIYKNISAKFKLNLGILDGCFGFASL